MKSILSIFRQNVSLVLFCCILSIVFLFRNVTTGDDTYFREALNTTDWLTFAIQFYKTWSGRYFFSIFFPTLIREEWIWLLRSIYICSSVVFAISFVRFIEFYEGKLLNIHQSIIFGTFFIFSLRSTSGAVVWLTGAFNYFLPFSLLLYAISTLIISIKSNKISNLNKITCALCILCAVSFEQVAFIAVMWLLYIKISNPATELKSYTTLLICIALVGAYILFSASGNWVRLSSEVQTWYPAYHQVSFAKKFYDMLQLLFEAVFVLNHKFTGLFFLALLLLVHEQRLARHLQIAAFVLICLIYVPLFFPYITNGLSLHPPYEQVLSIEQTTTHFIFNCHALLSMGYALITSLLALMLLSSTLARSHDLLPALFLLFIGAASFGCMIGSPTMYASGERTQFFMNMLFLLSFGMVVSRIKNTKYLTIILGTLLVTMMTFLPVVAQKITKAFL